MYKVSAVAIGFVLSALIVLAAGRALAPRSLPSSQAT